MSEDISFDGPMLSADASAIDLLIRTWNQNMRGTKNEHNQKTNPTKAELAPEAAATGALRRKPGVMHTPTRRASG